MRDSVPRDGGMLLHKLKVEYHLLQGCKLAICAKSLTLAENVIGIYSMLINNVQM